MATGIPRRSQWRTKDRPSSHALSTFHVWVITSTINKKGNWKMADLKAKRHFSHLCDALAVQAQWNCFIVLSYLPTQCINWSSGSLSIPTFEIHRDVGWPWTQKDPSKNRNSCLELCDVAGASSNSGPHERLLQKNLSFLNLMFSRLLRIIVCTWAEL